MGDCGMEAQEGGDFSLPHPLGPPSWIARGSCGGVATPLFSRRSKTGRGGRLHCGNREAPGGPEEAVGLREPEVGTGQTQGLPGDWWVPWLSQARLGLEAAVITEACGCPRPPMCPVLELQDVGTPWAGGGQSPGGRGSTPHVPSRAPHPGAAWQVLFPESIWFPRAH